MRSCRKRRRPAAPADSPGLQTLERRRRAPRARQGSGSGPSRVFSWWASFEAKVTAKPPRANTPGGGQELPRGVGGGTGELLKQHFHPLQDLVRLIDLKSLEAAPLMGGVSQERGQGFPQVIPRGRFIRQLDLGPGAIRNGTDPPAKGSEIDQIPRKHLTVGPAVGIRQQLLGKTVIARETIHGRPVGPHPRVELDSGFPDELHPDQAPFDLNGKADPVLIDSHLARQVKPSSRIRLEEGVVAAGRGLEPELRIALRGRAEEVDVEGLTILVELQDDPRTAAEEEPAARGEGG